MGEICRGECPNKSTDSPKIVTKSKQGLSDSSFYDEFVPLGTDMKKNEADDRLQLTANKSKYYYAALLIGLIVLIIDQITKFLTSQYLPLIESHYYSYPYGGIGVFRDFLGIEFSLNYMANKGAAWGVFGDYQIPLLLLRIGLIAGLVIYFVKYNTYPILQIPLALIIAGAVGNVLDYFIYGHVIDMFHFVLWGYDFPVFNVADSAISIGIGLLFLLSWLYS